MRMLTGQSATSAKNPYKKPIGIEAKFQGEEEDDEDETAHDILNEREEERPTVVVLKDGKHLDERQVKNILKNLPAGMQHTTTKVSADHKQVFTKFKLSIGFLYEIRLVRSRDQKETHGRDSRRIKFCRTGHTTGRIIFIRRR